MTVQAVPVPAPAPAAKARGFHMAFVVALGLLFVVLLHAVCSAVRTWGHGPGTDDGIRAVGSGSEFAARRLLLHLLNVCARRGRFARPMGRKVHHSIWCYPCHWRRHVRPRHRLGGDRRPVAAGRRRSVRVCRCGLPCDPWICVSVSRNGCWIHAVRRDARRIGRTIRRCAVDPRIDYLAGILALRRHS